MRSIDADALKEAVFSKSDSMEDLWDTAGVLNLINNAQTVDLKDIYQEGHYDGHIEGYTKAINEERPRSQGKWIKLRDYDFKCSLCGDSFMDEYDFCPDCGAKMQKGGLT